MAGKWVKEPKMCDALGHAMAPEGVNRTLLNRVRSNLNRRISRASDHLSEAHDAGVRSTFSPFAFGRAPCMRVAHGADGREQHRRGLGHHGAGRWLRPGAPRVR